jgi:hypothetical protein
VRNSNAVTQQLCCGVLWVCVDGTFDSSNLSDSPLPRSRSQCTSKAVVTHVPPGSPASHCTKSAVYYGTGYSHPLCHPRPTTCAPPPPRNTQCGPSPAFVVLLCSCVYWSLHLPALPISPPARLPCAAATATRTDGPPHPGPATATDPGCSRRPKSSSTAVQSFCFGMAWLDGQQQQQQQQGRGVAVAGCAVKGRGKAAGGRL